MKITVTNENLAKIDADALVVFLFENEKPTGKLEDLDKQISSSISQTLKLSDFKGKLYEVAPIYTHGKVLARRVILTGAGKKGEFDQRTARNIVGSGSRRAMKLGAKRLAVVLNDNFKTEDMVEGVGLASFDGGLYKSNKKEEGQIAELILVGKADPKEIRRSQVLVEASNWVRTMISEPANMMTPEKMVNEAKKLSKLYKFGIEVIDEKEAAKRGFGSFVGVAKGSEEPSYIVVLKYHGGGSETLGIIGKGITFDSGGISIKPSEKMHEMKYDMSGAAACFGVMKIAGELKPKVNLIMVTPLTENLPGGKAQKPGDVLKSLSGKTIEVLNTDAEGRLVLADALTYAAKLGATKLLDLATLTGAVLVALGSEAAAIVGNKEGFIEQVLSASKQSGERLWQLPIYPEHKEFLKSDVADMANIPPSRGAGVIAGGVFLKEFVDENTPWAHLDIAGTAWLDSEKPYMAKGATAFGVRTLVKLIEILEKQK